MLALIAVALANANGRGGRFLSDLLALRDDRRAVGVAFFGAFLLNAVVAAMMGALFHRHIGQGPIALFVALALVSAAAILLWNRAPDTAAELGDIAPAALMGRWSVAGFASSDYFLISALAATSGAGAWAAAGATIGWLLALLPFLAFGPALAAHPLARIVRYASAAILALWGIRTAMGAFGL